MTSRYDFEVFVSGQCPNFNQVVVPPDVLDAAKAKWTPPNDPIFQLVPLDFEPYVTQCFEDMEKPEVNLDTFWDVYCELQDLLEIAVPGDITEALNESTRDGDDVSEPFALAHLKEPDLQGEQEQGEQEEQEQEEEQEEVLCVDFTNEEDGDELF